MANGYAKGIAVPRGLQMALFGLAGACLGVLGAASICMATGDSTIAIALDPAVRISALVGAIAGAYIGFTHKDGSHTRIT